MSSKLITSESPYRPSFAGTAMGVSGTLIAWFFVTNLTRTLPSLLAMGFFEEEVVVVVVVVVVDVELLMV